MSSALRQLFFWVGVGFIGWAGLQFSGSNASTEFVERRQAANALVLRDVTDGELDTALAQAGTQARATLDRFLELAADTPDGWQQVNLQVWFEGAEAAKHIWVADFESVDGENFAAVLENSPHDLGEFRAGDPVTFTREQIADWAFVEGQRGYGFFSVRAKLPGLEGEQAAGMRAFLSDAPLPSYW